MQINEIAFKSSHWLFIGYLPFGRLHFRVGVGKITRSGVDQLTAIKIVFGDSRGRVTVTAPLVIGSTSFTCSIPKYLLVNIDFRGQGDSGKKNRLRPNEALN